MEAKLVAYAGKEGCESLMCRVMPQPDGSWVCVGWHCAVCDEPSSYQGHVGCVARDDA